MRARGASAGGPRPRLGRHIPEPVPAPDDGRTRRHRTSASPCANRGGRPYCALTRCTAPLSSAPQSVRRIPGISLQLSPRQRTALRAYTQAASPARPSAAPPPRPETARPSGPNSGPRSHAGQPRQHTTRTAPPSGSGSRRRCRCRAGDGAVRRGSPRVRGAASQPRVPAGPFPPR